MRQAMVGLLANTERYVITMRQAPVNRDTGDPQERELVLVEKDPLDLTVHLDAKLRRASEVKILLIDKSRRTVLIEFPQRSWKVLGDGTELRNRLTEFNDHLVIGAQSRMFTFSTCTWLILGPVFLWISVVIAWAIQAAIHEPRKTTPIPSWLNDFSEAVFYGILPTFGVAAFFVLIVISFSGALGVWPRTFTRRSLSESLYRVRASLFTPVSIAAIIGATTASVIAAIVSFLLTR